MRGTEDPFRPAKLLVSLASGDINKFQARCDAFLNESKMELIEDHDSQPEQVIHKVRVTDAVPDDLERDAVHLVGDLRSALDKAVHAASVQIGTSDPKYAHFPAADSEAGFKGQLNSGRGPYRGVPQELRDYLVSLKPWWGGNDILRSFLAFSNPTKHESILTVDVHFNGITIAGDGGRFHFENVGTVWNEHKTECEIFRTLKSRPIQGQIRIKRSIAFNNAERLSGHPFAPIIREIARIVNSIVLGLEAETERILRSNV